MDTEHTSGRTSDPGVRVVVSAKGPYLVSGGVPLAEESIESNLMGVAQKWLPGKRFPDRANYRLCRCGKSKTAPYCDNAHVDSAFDGRETAPHGSYLDAASKTTGPELELTDVPRLCAGARFCDRAGGTWALTERSAEPAARQEAIRQAAECPSGRLVAWDKTTGEPIEPVLEPSISVVEDPGVGVSGPLWLKGGIRLVSADGTPYETRNRVTVCRCGASENKPFCDGKHIPRGFKASSPTSVAPEQTGGAAP